MVLFRATKCASFFALGFVSTMLFGIVVTSTTATTIDQYDYVIIGGGTAGCAMAARICTSLPHATVVLIERGAPRNTDEEFIQQSMHNAGDMWVPGTAMSEIWTSEANPALIEANSFTFAPVLDEKGDLQYGRKVDIVTGSTLGGTSSIAANQWVVPRLEDVESWGFAGLDAATASKYYARAAAVVQPRRPSPHLDQNYTQDWLDAATRSGFFERAAGPELSSSHPFGTAFEHSIIFDPNTGRRRDSCTAYLKPAMAGACASSLTLIQSATVTKLVVEGSKVSSVEYVIATPSEGADDPAASIGDVLSVTASAEVILSAGPYGSPKLLQLSGIGPASVLSAAGIEQVAELPVGVNTQGRTVSIVVSSYAKPLDWSNDPSEATAAAREQFENNQGGVEGVPCEGITGGILEGAYVDGTFCLPENTKGFSAFVALCIQNPTSRGNMSITSSDPFAQPKVYLNLLNSDEEQESVETCLETLRAVHSSFPDDFGAFELFPGSVPLKDYALASTRNGLHFVGGCSVGSVVDEHLSLIGFDNVRIVDASVIPDIPRSAGPMSSVYMLAEYAAEKVINESRLVETDIPSASPIESVDSSSDDESSISSSSEDGGGKGRMGMDSRKGSKNGSRMGKGKRHLSDTF